MGKKKHKEQSPLCGIHRDRSIPVPSIKKILDDVDAFIASEKKRLSDLRKNQEGT